MFTVAVVEEMSIEIERLTAVREDRADCQKLTVPLPSIVPISE